MEGVGKSSHHLQGCSGETVSIVGGVPLATSPPRTTLTGPVVGEARIGAFSQRVQIWRLGPARYRMPYSQARAALLPAFPDWSRTVDLADCPLTRGGLRVPCCHQIDS